MQLRKIYYASSLVLIFGVHLNATVVAFIKASPTHGLLPSQGWQWAMKALAFPLGFLFGAISDSMQGQAMVAIFNSALWAWALAHLGHMWRERKGRQNAVAAAE